MKTRTVMWFAAMVLGLAGAVPCVAADEMKRMGILYTGSANQRSLLEGELVGVLQQKGFVEGRNIVITRRYAEGDMLRLASYARELQAWKPDVVVTMCTPSTRAMREASSTIPIVMTMISDPVGQRLIASLAAPGGNVTGTTSQWEDVIPKMLETMSGVLQRPARLAMLFNQNNSAHAGLMRIAEDTAPRFRLQVKRYGIASPGAVAGVLEALARDQQEALFVLPDDPMLGNARPAIIAFANRHRVVGLYPTREYVEAGGLLSYGQSSVDGYRQAATYVDRILRGARPASLAVAQPTKLELSVNLKTAREMGVTIPASLLMRADKVVE